MLLFGLRVKVISTLKRIERQGKSLSDRTRLLVYLWGSSESYEMVLL